MPGGHEVPFRYRRLAQVGKLGRFVQGLRLTVREVRKKRRERHLRLVQYEVIDIVDVAQVASAWSTTAWSIGYNPRADLVHDGRIDIADIATVVVLWQPH